MARVLDQAATMAMLAALKDGDKPLAPGDEFYHPEYGMVRVSRVLGWKDSLHFEGRNLKGIRVLVATVFRSGQARAERVSLALPTAEFTAKVPS